MTGRRPSEMEGAVPSACARSCIPQRKPGRRRSPPVPMKSCLGGRRTVVGYGPCGNDACRWAPESGMRLCRMSKVPSGKRRRCPKGAFFSEACRSCCGKPSRSEGMRIASDMRKPFLPLERSDRFRVCSPLRRKARSSRNRSCAVPFRGGVFAVGGTLVDGSGRRCLRPQRLWADDIR